MKLVLTSMGVDYCICENNVINLVIENPELLVNVLRDLKNQQKGEDGELIKIGHEGELAFNKFAQIVIDPFDININDKKVLGKIYKDIASEINEYHVNDYYSLASQIINFADKIIFDSNLLLTSDVDIDIVDILKLINLRVMDDAEDFVERLTNYFELINDVLNINLFIVYNLKMLLTIEQYDRLCMFCFYKKIILINIGGYEVYHTDFDKNIIIDKDYCVLYT